jgi:hypothetical protein
MFPESILSYHLRMKQFLVTVPRNLMGCFTGWRLVWHVVAIVLTFILVLSGFDWHWFLATRNPALRSWMWPAVRIGGLLPSLCRCSCLSSASLSKFQNHSGRLGRWAGGTPRFVCFCRLQGVTGRVHPAHSVGADISHVFRFGWMRGGVFWGWPSSHTTIAFAMAVTVFTLCPKQRWLGWVAILYACYVGLGVSMTIHWFSDFVAGAIIGSVIGAVVGKCFGETSNIERPISNIE